MNGIHTYDIFDNENVDDRLIWFEYCHKKALKCGLICKCYIEDVPKLELWGTKLNMFKYYLTTICKCDRKLRGILRTISILFT